MAAPAPRKRSKAARCPQHGLVLVDGQQCALCKSSRARATSPWLLAALGGVAAATLIVVRALDAGEPPATAAPSPAPSGVVTTTVERSRPAFERVPARELAQPRAASSPSATAPSRAAPAPLLAVEASAGSEAVPAEDRWLGQPAAALPPPAHANRPPPPDPPGVRGFLAPARADDPADFD